MIELIHLIYAGKTAHALGASELLEILRITRKNDMDLKDSTYLTDPDEG